MIKIKEWINNRIKKLSIIDYYLIAYFIVNLFFLKQFPMMHSDESWLSGLTRSMMDNGLGATEYFFDLLPRYPHAIKTIYHVLQMLFIFIFGYNLFTVRLLSLVFGMAALISFYKLASLFLKPRLALIGTIILSLDIQFIYAAHFARQEIIIVAILLYGIYYICKNAGDWRIKRDVFMAGIVGFSVGNHPNSFIVALALGMLYLYFICFEKKLKIKNLLIFVGGVILFTGVFVGLSFLFDKNFIPHYLTYGDNLGTTNSWFDKIFGFPKFYQRLYFRTNITYYTPMIKIQFVLFSLSFIFAAIGLIFSKKRDHLLKIMLPILAVNSGFLLIGRYSQPSIILIFPLCYLLIFSLIQYMLKKEMIIAFLLGAVVLTSTVFGIVPYLNNDYDDYIDNIKKTVPSDKKTLANLNAEYALNYNMLYDYRNLVYLKEADMSFEAYIEKNKIEYIIYPEEMDFIYENRPVWNVMYGNLFYYYDEMNDYLKDDCNLLSEFNSPYAMRNLNFIKDKDWTVKVYQIKKEEER